MSWKPQHFDSDLYRIRVSLFEGGRQIDAAESGFVVWDPKIIAQGPEVDFHGLFPHPGRALLLIGSRTMGFDLTVKRTRTPSPGPPIRRDAPVWDKSARAGSGRRLHSRARLGQASQRLSHSKRNA